MQRLLPCFTAQDSVTDEQDACTAPRIVHAPSTTPVEAWQQQKITLAFSGAGFLMPYHLGAYQALAIMGIADASSPMAGASAGSLVVSAVKSGVSVQQQMDSFLEVAHECRRAGVAGRLRAVLKKQLVRSLPPDAHARCSDGTCWLSITQVLPRPANKLYGAFDSRHQLIKALLASCHLPRLSDGGLFTSYKSVHKRCFDGGFSNLVPVPPAPPPTFIPAAARSSATTNPAVAAASEGVAVTIARTPAAAAAATTAAHAQSASAMESLPTAPAAALQLREHSTKGISTQLGAAKRSVSSSKQHLHGSSSGKHRVHLASSFNKSSGSSSSDGKLWSALAASCEVAGSGAYVQAPGWFVVRVCVLPVKSLSNFPAMFRAPTAEEVSIAIDKHQPWPHTLEETTNLALYPQDDDFLWDLFERGRADAVSWAQQQGFEERVLQRMQVTADDAALPASLRVVRPVVQQEEQQGQDEKQRQQEAATVAVAASGARSAAAGVAAAAER